jgi:hypothetical protein
VDINDAGHGHNTLLTVARAYPKGSANTSGVHELLERLVCTNSMFPPIH